MGTQKTWYCPIVNITTSAIQTCSFQLPVHSYRLLMNKNASPPRKNREIFYKYLLASLQLCETLGLESYNIRYYLFFYLSFIRLIFMPKAQTTYHKISTGRSIAFIAENINKAHMATRTVTVVLKNVVQPCRCPFTQG